MKEKADNKIQHSPPPPSLPPKNKPIAPKPSTVVEPLNLMEIDNDILISSLLNSPVSCTLSPTEVDAAIKEMIVENEVDESKKKYEEEVKKVLEEEEKMR